MDFQTGISRVRDIVNSISSSKAQDPVVSKTIFLSLCQLLEIVQEGRTAESVVLAPANLSVLEDICSNKFLLIGKGLQTVIVSIYHGILHQVPGYAVRNTINSMLQIISNKVSTVYSRDCALAVIGKLMETRSFDCGSQINDIVAALLKSVRGSDISSRLIAINSLISLVVGAGSKIGDCHAEIVKICSKYNADRNADVRTQVGNILGAVARNSSGGSSVPPETLVAALVRGLEDENLVVQDVYVRAYAALLSEQFRAYLEQAEKAKIGLARGSDAPATTSKRRLSVSMPKLSITAPKKLVEDFQFRNIIGFIVKGITKSVGSLRNGYIAVMSHFIRESLAFIDQNELELLVNTLLDMFRDPAFALLTYEEMIYLKARMGNILSVSVAKQLNESRLLGYAGILIAYVANMETRGEYELQLALGELCHVLLILGEAAVAIVDDIQASISVHLRHSSFGVRSASANVICSLAGAVPGIASTLLRTSLANAKEFAKSLGKFEVFDAPAPAPGATTGVTSPPLPAAGGASLNMSGHSADVTDDPVPTDPTKRRNPKETERLQRMYYFHGHTLVISLLMKNENKLVSGIPNSLVQQIFDFGLELLQLEVLSVHFTVRNVCCSMLRAGSLVVSSCLNRGYLACKPYIMRVLTSCDKVFTEAAPLEGSSKANLGADDLLFELMSVEAALVCLATLLWSCPDSLEHEEGALVAIIDGLEKAFKLIKGKYQPKFRNHFRFRILHTIVLECFAWLPPGSFPNTCQLLFIEALRVFRDAIGANSECSCLSDIVSGDYALLNSTTASSAALTTTKISGMNNPDVPVTGDMLLLRLESYAVVLPRKESEALLASFNKDQHMAAENRSQYLPGIDWVYPRAPCFLIDSRTIDAAIGVVATTFGHQTIEFQEKCVNLCVQMLSQLMKSSSMSMFSSDEEKRKRERKLFVTVKGVIACLFSIVKAFPFLFFASPSLNLTWAQTVVDCLLEYTSHSSLEVRVAAGQAVAHLASHMTRASLLDSVFTRISSAISLASEKKGNDLSDLSGSMLALGELWINASARPSLQKTIYSAMLDFLRRTDISFAFRAHGVVALACVVPGALSSSADDSEFFVATDRLSHFIEANIVSVQSTDDGEVLFCGLVRLIGQALHSVFIHYDGQALTSNVNGIVSRLLRSWGIIRETYYHDALQLESTNVLLKCGRFAGFVEKMSFPRISDILNVIAGNCFVSNNISTLEIVVDIVEVVGKSNPTQSFEAGLDVSLFRILTWCISSVTCPSSISYSGIDIRCCSQLGLNFGQDNAALQLCEKTEVVIRRLYEAFNSSRSDVHSMRTALFLRAVALGLRPLESAESSNTRGGGGDGGGGEDDHNDGDDEEVPQSQASRRAVTTATRSSTSVGAMTTQQFCSSCRDAAQGRWHDAPACFLRVKCLAVRLTSFALNQLTYRGSSVLHSDLQLARDVTRQQLLAITSEQPQTLQQLPCFAVLFLHDLVNLACACSTYTINDKMLQSLQCDSIALLEKIILLFFNTTDPDAADAGLGSSNKILSQFISQILSAVRPCLGGSYSPELSSRASSVVCLLIAGGFLADKVAVRRLIKLLFASTEEKDKDKDNIALIQRRARVSEDTSDVLAVLGHIVEVQSLAQLHLLSLQSFLTKDVEPAVRSAIVSTLQEHISHLSSVWAGMVIDAVRVLQPLPATEAIAPQDGNGNSSSAKSNQSSSSLENGAVSCIWPEMTIETDPRRGGIIYTSDVQYKDLISPLKRSLPVFLAAVTASPACRKESVCELFSVCSIALCELMTEYVNIQAVVSQSETNIFCSQQAYLLSAAHNIAKYELEQQSSNQSCNIPVAEWANVAAMFAQQVLRPAVVEYYSPSVLSTVINMSIDTLSLMFSLAAFDSDSSGNDSASFLKTPTPATPTTPVSKRAPNITRINTSSDLQGADEKQSLFAWLWTSALVLASRVFPFSFAGNADVVHATALSGTLPDLSPVTVLTASDDSLKTLSCALTAGCGEDKEKTGLNNDVNKLVYLLACLARHGSQLQRTYVCRLLVGALPVVCGQLTRMKQLSQRDSVIMFWTNQLIDILKYCVPSQENEMSTHAAVQPSPIETSAVASSFMRVALDELASWHKELLAGESTGLLSNPDCTAAAVDSLFYLWKQACSLTVDNSFSLPKALVAIVLQTSQTPILFTRALLTNVVSSIQADPTKCGIVLVESLLPVVMTVLVMNTNGAQGQQQPMDESIELLLVQFIFIAFNLCDEARKGDFIGMFMAPLCGLLCSKAQPQESASAMFVGKGLTLLARNSADPFREAVAALGESHRAALQSVMRMVILQQQAAEAQATAAAAASAPIKKIDMSKYKS